METQNLKTDTMDKLNATSIIARIKSKTPPFWGKFRRWMIACGAIGAAIAAMPAEHTSWIPQSLQNVDSILITIGVVGTAISSLTVMPTELSNEQPEEGK